MTKFEVIPSKNTGAGDLLLDIPIDKITIPDWLKKLAQDNEFEQKDEFHITLISGDLGELIVKNNLLGYVDELTKSTIWKVSLIDKYIELAKLDENNIQRQSIIQMASIDNIEAFYQKLQAIVKVGIPIPPTHVTLYTRNYKRGIGLLNDKDLANYTVRNLSK